MKFIYAFGIAVLLAIAAALWFSQSEDKASAIPSRAVASDFDAGQHLAGNVETPLQQGSQQPVTPSSESIARHDFGSSSATAAPADEATHSTPGTEQGALRNATETIPGQLADTKSSQPSAIDKTDCVAAARTLEESWSIFDVTPTQAIWYARERSPNKYARPNGFAWLKEKLLAPLCAGDNAFDQAYQVRMEFVAVSADSHVRILVGDYWISDGTVLSPLSDEVQESLTTGIQKRRDGPGPNSSREGFERQLARNPRALLPPSFRDGT